MKPTEFSPDMVNPYTWYLSSTLGDFGLDFAPNGDKGSILLRSKEKKYYLLGASILGYTFQNNFFKKEEIRPQSFLLDPVEIAKRLEMIPNKLGQFGKKLMTTETIRGYSNFGIKLSNLLKYSFPVVDHSDIGKMEEEDVIKGWKLSGGHSDYLDEMIERHEKGLRGIINKSSASGFYDIEELYNSIVMQVKEGLNRFDLTRKVKFRTFIQKRMTGSLTDIQRKADPLSRKDRNLVKELQSFYQRFMNEHDLAPEEDDYILDLKLTDRQWMKCKNYINPEDTVDSTANYLAGYKTQIFEEIADRYEIDPYSLLEQKEKTNNLWAAVDTLPDMGRLVMKMLYEDEMTQKEVGKAIDVEESRICQIHAAAVERLSQIREIQENRITFSNDIKVDLCQKLYD